MLSQNKKRILLVEAIKDVQWVFEAILETEYQIFAVKNPEEALIMLPYLCPDAIVLSFQNYDRCTELFDYARHFYPICYFTLNYEHYCAAKELASENDACLQIPLNVEEFLEEMQRITADS